MAKNFEARLRRMGVKKGARNLKSAGKPQPPAAKTDLNSLLPGGRVEENEFGQFYVVDKVYPLSHVHGAWEIGRIFTHQPTILNAYLKQEYPESFDKFLFIDTETTGLAGAGTIAFMVGVGFFEQGKDGQQRFIVRQYFVRDFGEEAAMLSDLELLVERYPNFVSFNGKTFDIPLLKNRYLMNRMPEPLTELPHLDLLHPARRLWRRRFGSVALSELEHKLLGIPRTQQDVPGALIPAMYHDFVRTGNPRPMLRVFYHNHIDILSMVTLTIALCSLIQSPDQSAQPLDLFSLGKWQADLDFADAETTLRQAAALDADLEIWHQILLELSWILKRAKRRDEALKVWQQVAFTTSHNTIPHVELAKHFEWHETDLPRALDWTEKALAMVPIHRHDIRGDLSHRKRRLQRKIKANSV